MAAVIEHAADFGDDRALENLRMLRDEEEADELEHLPVAIVPPLGMQEQAADLAWAVVFFIELEDRDFLADVDHLGFEERAFDLVAVEGLKPADLGDDAAGADHARRCGREVLHDEEI